VKDLKYSPTAVGGIKAFGDWCYRKDLNDPPTAVGGIICAKLTPALKFTSTLKLSAQVFLKAPSLSFLAVDFSNRSSRETSTLKLQKRNRLRRTLALLFLFALSAGLGSSQIGPSLPLYGRKV